MSSFYARLARANAYSLHELGSKLLGETQHSITASDLDLQVNPRLLTALAKRTHQSTADLDLAMLGRWTDRLSARDCAAKAPTRWALDRRKRSDQRRHGYWVQVCPQCLQEDNEPYIRLLWRLAFVTECPLHGVGLIDRCHECGGSMDFLRASQSTLAATLQPLSHCWRCGGDWRHADAPVSDTMLLGWLRDTITSISQAWFAFETQVVPSALYFDGIFLLQRALRSTSDGGSRLFRSILTQVEEWGPLPGAGEPFERLSVAERRLVCLSLARLLRHWPDNFVILSRRAGVRWNAFGNQKATVPWWLESVGRSALDRTWYQPSDAEAAAVEQFLSRKGFSGSRMAVREWLGSRVQKPALGVRPLGMDEPSQLTIGLPPVSTECLLCRAFVQRIVKKLRAYCIPKSKQCSPTKRHQLGLF